MRLILQRIPLLLVMPLLMQLAACGKNEPEPQKQRFAADATILREDTHESARFTTLSVGESLDIYIGNKETGEAYNYTRATWKITELSEGSPVYISSTTGNRVTVYAQEEGDAIVAATDETYNSLGISVTVNKAEEQE